MAQNGAAVGQWQRQKQRQEQKRGSHNRGMQRPFSLATSETMLPQLDVLFPHQPIAGPVRTIDRDESFDWQAEVATYPMNLIDRSAPLRSRKPAEEAAEAAEGSLIDDSYPPDWSEERKKSVPLAEWRVMQRKLLSACIVAFNPWSSVSRELRHRLDRGVSYTNAFTKMYEMCHVEEVKAVLDRVGMASGAKAVLSVACLAEAPGFFLVAIMYYLGVHYPSFFRFGLVHAQCTTLPYIGSTAAAKPATAKPATAKPATADEAGGEAEGEAEGKAEGEAGGEAGGEAEGEAEGESETALPDTFSLISSNIQRWFFMDHTSVKDTRAMVAKLGAGSRDLVTGDIGKPTEHWYSLEREVYREELGQLVAACAVLRDEGVAVLKMFTITEYATACLLRLVIGLFARTRVFKPLTSRPNNAEAYWILSGFKRHLFEAVYEDLLRVMDDANRQLADAGEAVPLYRGFLRREGNFDESPLRSSKSAACPVISFSERLRRMNISFHLRNQPFLRQGIIEYMRVRWPSSLAPLRRSANAKRAQVAGQATDDPYTNPFSVQLRLMRGVAPLTHPYTMNWLSLFPISPLGSTIYRLLNITPSASTTTSATAAATSAAATAASASDE